MPTRVIAAALAVLILIPAAQPLLAKDRDDDDDDDRRGRGRKHERGWERERGRESGPRTKFENSAERYRYEYRDGRCRYEYEYRYETGRTKIEQKGDCGHVAFARPVAGREVLPRAIPPEPQASRIECNRQVLGAVLGGAVGAVVGSRVGDRDSRPVTTVGGAVIGSVIGGAIGRDMDRADQACAAQALEYAGLNQSVSWKSPTGANFTVTPLGVVPGSRGSECRKYVVRTGAGAQQEHSACRQGDGSWAIVR